MKDNKYIISKDFDVKKTIEHMEENLIKAVLITDEEDKVLGLFSNGDMRHFFLCGGSLSENICEVMNKNPKLFSSEEEVFEERKNQKRVVYPIVDDNNHIIDILDFDNQEEAVVCNSALADVPLVIMAGGKGTRLYPYTKILPKPLIPIGDLSITERIIESFTKYGCKEVMMILNYKANMIKAYMADLKKDYSIDYVEETKFLGTGGGLGLLKGKINTTFFLSNCDILVTGDLECAYETHKKKGNKITFICSMKDVVIPYGVVETNEDGMITDMKEKPGFSYLVNTGLYIIEPDVIADLKEDEFIHLPDLAQRYLDKGEKVGVFPISEKAWMDMGQFTEMENMLKELGIK